MLEIHVGMGEINIGTTGDTLSALGLGSCVAVVLYDPVAKVAGAAHIMLPDSTGHEFTIEKTVLLADADANVRKHIRDILTSYHYIISAETKERDETLAFYGKTHPGASLISAFLPPANWFDVTQHIIKLDRDSNIIILSPDIDRMMIFNYLNNGATEVITAPFT